MGLKDAITNAVENVKDTVNQGRHGAAADAEQTKRDVAGDQMTVGENVGSMFNQAKNSVQADTSEAKREARNTTT